MTHGHIIFKVQKIKDKVKILEEARVEQNLIYIEIRIRVTSDFFSETR